MDPNPAAVALDVAADQELARLDSCAPMRKRGTKRTMAFRSAGELLAEPCRLTWLIHKTLGMNDLAQIFGDPGAGKTFLALDWACCVSTGTPWEDLRVLQGAVFYVAGEGYSGLKRRLEAWQLSNGIPLAEAPLFFSTMPASLTDDDGIDDLLSVVRDLIEEHGKPVLVVLDTVARNFGGGDENSTKDMTTFVAACDVIREETGATVLTVHHSGHGEKKRSRGSSALKGALDAEYSLTSDAGVVHFACTKAKDFEPPSPVAFKLCKVELGYTDDEGDPVTSAVLQRAIYIRSAKGTAGCGANQTKAKRILQELQAAREAELIAQGHDPDLASVPRRAWREACAREGLKGNRFGEVEKSLSRAGFLRVDGDNLTIGTGEDWEIKE